MLAVRMPRFDADGTPATLLRWYVEVGQEVGAGDALALVECDKATLELEAAADGALSQRLVPDGATVPPFTVLGWLAELGHPEDPPCEP